MRSRVILAVVGVVLVMGVLVVWELGPAKGRSGPLAGATNHISAYAVPSGEPMFYVLRPCLRSDEARLVRLTEVRPGRVRGVRAEDVDVRVAVLEPDEKQKYGAAKLSQLPAAFQPLDESAGVEATVQPCEASTASRGLEIAVFLPDPGSTAVRLDDVVLEYEVAGRPYEYRETVTFAICAERPAVLEDEPESCQEAASGRADGTA